MRAIHELKNDRGKSDCVTLELPGETGFNDHWITGSRIKDHQTKDSGSVQNELINKLSKLIGMSDGSSTLLSQNLFLVTDRRCFFSPSPVRRLSRYHQERLIAS